MSQILIDGFLGSFFIEFKEIDYDKLYNDILEHIHLKFNIPKDILLLSYDGKNVQSICKYNRDILENRKDSWMGPFHLNLPVKGGKGGFGSLLRGGPKGVKVNKVTNRDACRDLSGRRLRHVEGERKLKEWVENVRDESIDERRGIQFVEQQQQKNLKEQTLQTFTNDSKDVKQKINESLKKGILLSKKKRKIAKSEESNKQQENDEDGKQDKEEEEITEQKIEIKEREEEIVEIKENKDDKDEKKELDLSKYHSAKELESLGLESLKSILESRGAKCGGTLAQRAERLFAIKDLKEIPQEHKATQQNKRKRKK